MEAVNGFSQLYKLGEVITHVKHINTLSINTVLNIHTAIVRKKTSTKCKMSESIQRIAITGVSKPYHNPDLEPPPLKSFNRQAEE